MHVLVPVDRSEPAESALEFALENYEDATITALHVVDPPEVMIHSQGAGSSISENVKRRKEAASSLLEDLESTAAQHDAELETHVAVGKVERKILEYTEENDVDAIVIGSHGRTGWSRITLGSVAENVVRRSPVPVTVVQ